MREDVPESSEQLHHTPESDLNYGVDFDKRYALRDAIDEYRRIEEAEQDELDAQKHDRQREMKAVNMGTHTPKKRPRQQPKRGRYTIKGTLPDCQFGWQCWRRLIHWRRRPVAGLNSPALRSAERGI